MATTPVQDISLTEGGQGTNYGKPVAYRTKCGLKAKRNTKPHEPHEYTIYNPTPTEKEIIVTSNDPQAC